MIGIFDSGQGGLSVLKALKQKAPAAEVVYFGDIANAPYGNRSREDLEALTVSGIQKLLDAGADEIISACNSVSVQIVEPLFNQLKKRPEHMIEMVGPTMEALRPYKNETMLLVATRATVDSGMYQRGLSRLGISIESRPIPDLAGRIEAGEPMEAFEESVRSALADVPLHTYSTIILGCTHFPLAKEAFTTVLAERDAATSLFDPAEPVAARAAWLMNTDGDGSIRFLISQDSQPFRARVEEYFGDSEYSIEVVE